MEYNSSLKHIYKRKLKGGDWVVLAAGSDPLVVSEEVARELTNKNTLIDDFDADIASVLRDSGFIEKLQQSTKRIPEEGAGLKWSIFRFGLLVVGVISFAVVLFVTPIIGLPVGSKIITNEVPLWLNLLFVLFFSVSTTLLHEFMHMLYARTLRNKSNEHGLNLEVKKSTATVSMTHIWVWSFISRITALVAGIAIDLLLLSCCSIAQLFFDSWLFVTASAVLWIRILWQFRFHKNCDGQLIAITIFDNPMIAIDARDKPNNSQNRKELVAWRGLSYCGYITNIVLLLGWVIPFILNIWGYISTIFR